MTRVPFRFLIGGRECYVRVRAKRCGGGTQLLRLGNYSGFSTIFHVRIIQLLLKRRKKSQENLIHTRKCAHKECQTKNEEKKERRKRAAPLPKLSKCVGCAVRKDTHSTEATESPI